LYHSPIEEDYKSLLSYNGSVPLDDRFCCESDLLPALNPKEKGHLYDMGERNGAVVAKQALIKVCSLPVPVGPDSLILPLDMTDYSLYDIIIE